MGDLYWQIMFITAARLYCLFLSPVSDKRLLIVTAMVINKSIVERGHGTLSAYLKT
jgi:hypothetical protein